MARVAGALAVILSMGCYESRLVDCGDGRLCPVATVCVDPALGGCVSPERIDACSAKAEGELCMFTGFSGTCQLGVCVECDSRCELAGPKSYAVWSIATTDGAGTPDPELVYTPLGVETVAPEKPTVHVGAIGGTLTEIVFSMTDGSFEVPTSLAQGPHRIVFSYPNEAPSEFQWNVTGAYVTVPRTTRFEAPAPPINSRYRIAPVGMPATPAVPALATSGVFTFTSTPEAFTILFGVASFEFSKARPLIGRLGTPTSAHDDWVLMMSFKQRTASQLTVDGWALTQIDLAPNTTSSPATEPVWITTEVTKSAAACPSQCFPTFNGAAAQQRLVAQLGMPGGTITQSLAYGVSPSTELPGILLALPPTFERPLLIPFALSSTLDPSITLADPSDMLQLERVVYARVATTRVVDGAQLTSSLNVTTNVLAGPVAYAAPLVTAIMLGTTNLSTTEGVRFTPSAAFETLTFTPEPGYVAHDYIVVLWEVAGGTLVPVRDYLVLAPSISIDTSQLAAGRTYVFAISARNGYPTAAQGDYRKATHPFSVSTTMSRTFIAQ